MTPHGSRMFRYSNFGGGVCVAATTRWLQTCRTNNFTIRPGPDHQVLASQQHYETVQLLQRLEDSVNIDYYAILARAGFNVIRSVSTPSNEGNWGDQLSYMSKRSGLYYSSFNMQQNPHPITIPHPHIQSP